MKKVLFFGALLAFAGVATAGNALDIAGRASFAEQRDQVMADLADGETYAEISAEDRAEVVASLGRMERMIGDSAPASLHPDARVALMNEQEKVNTILTQAGQDSRMICNRETTVGTRMPTTVCRTVAERRRLRDNSRQQFEAAGRGRANTIL